MAVIKRQFYPCAKGSFNWARFAWGGLRQPVTLASYTGTVSPWSTILSQATLYGPWHGGCHERFNWSLATKRCPQVS
jgi:hypothetical protein